MNSTTMIILVILATSGLVQGIAIGGSKDSSAVAAEAPATTSVNVNNGFAVQSGYEGYILTPQKASGGSSIINTWLALPKLQIIKSLLRPVASFLVVYGFKAFKAFAHLFIALVLGVVTTTAVCTLTPLCSISLATPGLGLLKGQAVKEQIAALARTYMTPENLEMASKLARSALDKYSYAPVGDEVDEQVATAANETENETVS